MQYYANKKEIVNNYNNDDDHNSKHYKYILQSVS